MPPPLARGALAFARQRNEENKTTPVLQTKKRMNSEINFFFKLSCILIWHKDSALVYKTLCSLYFSYACPGMYRAFLPLVLRFIQPQNFEDKDCVPNLYSVAWSEPKSRVFGFPKGFITLNTLFSDASQRRRVTGPSGQQSQMGLFVNHTNFAFQTATANTFLVINQSTEEM